MAGVRQKDSLRDLAARYGVSHETVNAWKKLGVDVTDAKAVEEYRNGGVSEEDAVSLQEARRRKVIKDTELVQIRIEREEGKLVPVDQVTEAGMRIGVVVKQGLLRLENDLPPQLEGLSAAKMKKRLREILRNMLREWEDFTEEAIEDAKSAD